MGQRTSYIKRVIDPELSLPAFQKVDNRPMWMLKNLLDHQGTAEESSFFEDDARRVNLCCFPTNARRRASPRGLEGSGCRWLKHGGCQHPSEAWWRRYRRFLLVSRAL